jgi:drug/metabolite transporter (DMT)-like permease
LCFQIAVQDEGDDSPQTLFGDLVALGAAAFYGLYTTTIRVQVWSRVASPFRIVVKYVVLQVPEDESEEDGVSMQLLFGYIGALTAVGLSPCLFFLVSMVPI